MQTYLLKFQDNSVEKMASSRKFHSDNDVIFTTKDEIDVEEVFNHVKGKLNDFWDESQFIILCGFHTSVSGKIGATDHDLTYDYQEMFERFHCHKRYPKEAKIVAEKRFQMGTVIPIGSIRDWSQKPEEVFKLSKQSKSQIKMLFEDVLSKKRPIVLILASCYSYKSDIFNTLQACGLPSAISLLQEHGNITCGKLLHLDAQQQKFLKTIAEDLTKKDVIIGGE